MKSRQKILLYIAIAIVYVSMLFFIEPSLDYLIPWFSAEEISAGTPLYEQSEYKIIDKQEIAFPYHLPIYIYLLALIITIFGNTLLPGRILLVVITFLNAILVEQIINQETNSKEHHRINSFSGIIYLLNPFVIIPTITGYFDGLPLLYLLCAYILFTKIEKSTKSLSKIYSSLSGLYLFFGIMTKIIPLVTIPVFILVLLKKRKVTACTIFSISSFMFSILTIMFLGITYPSFWYFGLEWQVTRGSQSFSLFYYSLDLEFVPNAILIGICSIILVISLLKDLNDDKSINIFIYVGLFLTMFLVTYRVFYPHYIMWLIPVFSYTLINYIQAKSWKHLTYLIVIFLIQLIVNLFWIINESQWLNIPKTILFFFSVINTICLYFYLVSFYEKRLNKMFNEKKLY